MKNNKSFTFVDLFAGIGGFHQALESLGGTCVMASEIDLDCKEVYKNNFSKTPQIGDINKYWKELPKFDMLCGGFPCQPFSKAGKQKGFDDEDRGNLFYKIIEILQNHPECKFLLLENVSNLTTGKTKEWWNKIQEELQKLNFYVTDEPIVLSPCQFGIPQIRERVYIMGIRTDIKDDTKLKNHYIHKEDLGVDKLKRPIDCLKIGDAWKVLESNQEIDEKYYLSEEQTKILDIWDEFRAGTNYKTIGVPIWLEYFGFNKDEDTFRNTPDYQKVLYRDLPDWKKRFVDKNRQFYLDNKKFIDYWINKYDMLSKNSIYKKFEWNCGTDCKYLKETIIQFRHSGIRAKRPTYFPTLVAINNTPIIWDENKKRYRKITPREAANLQSFRKSFIFGQSDEKTYKQLGNAVNVKIIKKLAQKLIWFAKDNWEDM
ncbi:MAG: DNA (cytosine-5-)-methyltransferase [Clostridia bacterium]|nr:DNA (cytosine-5-)-methyltransferase [Clostridia bacterium]